MYKFILKRLLMLIPVIVGVNIHRVFHPESVTRRSRSKSFWGTKLLRKRWK